MMGKLWIVAALASTAIASPALARDQSGYVGVEGGPMRAQNLDPDFSDSGTEIDGVFNIDLDTGFDVDLVGGYDFGLIRIEGEVGYKRASIGDVQINPPLVLAGTEVDGSGRASVLSGMVNVLLDFEDDSGWGGYLGGGAGVARTKVNTDVSGTGLPAGTGFSGSDRNHAWQAIAGVRAAVTDNIDLGVKYRFFHTKFRFEDGGADLSDRFKSHSLLASLVYNFGAPAAPPLPAPPPPPTPPPPPATQTCPDGSVILATDTCPVPPPPPPPPPPEPERG